MPSHSMLKLRHSGHSSEGSQIFLSFYIGLWNYALKSIGLQLGFRTDPLYLSNCSYLFIVVLLTFSRVIIADCTGEMNQPLRLRCVRFIHLCTEWTLWCVCWIMNDCRARRICPYAYGMFADIAQWMSLVVCLLDYEWLSGETNLPLRLRNVRWYTFYAMNEPCGVFVGLWMIVERDESAPTPAVCSLLYIYALNRPCGMSVDIHFK